MITIDYFSQFNGTGATLTQDHLVYAQNSVLVVFAFEGGGASTSTQAVKFNGTPLTKLIDSAASTDHVQIWYMVNPPVGVYPVVYTQGDAAATSGYFAYTLSGVDIKQLTPVTLAHTGGDPTTFNINVPTAGSIVLEGLVVTGGSGGMFPNNKEEIPVAYPFTVDKGATAYIYPARSNISFQWNVNSSLDTFTEAAIILEPARGPSINNPNVTFRSQNDLFKTPINSGSVISSIVPGFAPTSFQNSFLHTIGRLIGSSPAPIGPQLVDGLVAYYKFDETTGSLVKDELNNYPGQWANMDTGIHTQGKINYAANFNTNSVNVSNGLILGGQKNSSVSFWASLVDNPGGNGGPIYTERAASGNDIYKVDFTNAAPIGRFRFVFRDDAGTLSQPDTGNNVYVDGLMHHFVMTKSGTAVNLYVDGNLITSATLTGTDTFTNASLQALIGADAGDAASKFHGMIDEVGLWQRALTQDEVIKLYNNGQGLQYPFIQPPAKIGPFYSTNAFDYYQNSFLYTIGRIIPPPPPQGTPAGSTEFQTSQIVVDKVYQGEVTAVPVSTVTLTLDVDIPSPEAVLVVAGGSVITTGAAWADVSYNGNKLTKLTQAAIAGADAETWWLPFPSVGVGQLVITSGTGGEIYANAMVILGIDRRSTNIQTISTTAATSTVSTFITPDAPNSLIIDTIATLNATQPPVPTTSQTQVYNATALVGNEYVVSGIELASQGQPIAYNLGVAVNSSLVAVVFRPANAASMWYPNIDLRSLEDVITTSGLDAGINPPFGSYGYKPSQLYQNSFLHTVGRNNQGMPLPVTTGGNDWPTFMSGGFMNPRFSG